MGNGRASSSGSRSVTHTAPAKMSLWHSLQVYPGFRLLFHSTVATNSAFWTWNLAAGWLALVMTDSPFFVGLTGFLGGIPMLLFALPGGVLVDRFDRRKILLLAQAAVAIIAAIVTALLLLDLMQPWHLLVAAFANGSAMSFVFPTRNALVANLVPAADLSNAVALNAAGQNAPRVIGPALAGPAIASIGIAGTFLLCAAVQALALLFTYRLPRVSAAPSPVRRTLWGSMAEGLSVIWRNEYLTGLVILAAVPTMLVMPYSQLLPVFAEHDLEIGAVGLGALMAANGAGGVLGALAVAGWRRLGETPGMLIWTAAGFALSVFAFAVTPDPLLAGVLIFLAGLISSVYMALNNTYIQLAVDDSIRGRVMGIYLLTWGLLPLGTLPVGAAADRYGAPLAVAGMVVFALLLILLAAVRFSSLRGGPASASVVTSEVQSRR